MRMEDYQLAWAVYVVSALICLLGCFYFTGWMWRYLREPIRLAFAVLLLTPTIIHAENQLYAPAAVVAAAEYAFNRAPALIPLADLLSYAMLALAIYGVFVVVRLIWWKFIKQQKANSKSRRQVLAGQDNAAVHADSRQAKGSNSRKTKSKTSGLEKSSRELTLSEILAAEKLESQTVMDSEPKLESMVARR